LEKIPADKYFDEEYPGAAFEDVDFCIKNGNIIVNENIIAYHDFGSNVYGRFYRYGQSYPLFMEKNEGTSVLQY
jgi:hypothetical protein